MGDFGSSLVFATGSETKTVNVVRTIDRLRIDRATFDFLNRAISVRISKGFINPVSLIEEFITIVDNYPIDDVSAPLARAIDGKSFTVPSGTHFTDAETDFSAENLLEHIEDYIFAKFEAMTYFSGTEIPA